MVEIQVKQETRYQVLKKIDIKRLVCLGIMNPELLSWLTVYEMYLKEIENNKVGVAKQFVADEFNISYRTVSRIVKFMTD